MGQPEQPLLPILERGGLETLHIVQTLLGITIFYRTGLGLFGKVDRVGQLLIVFAIWTAQLVIAPIWLRHFAFGPLEWLWRSLTYWKPQRMRVVVVST